MVFALAALLALNATYLLGVRILEAASGQTYQNWFFMNMFLLHLVLGFVFVLPVIVFGIAHMRNAYNRPNRRAVMVGYGLFATALVLLVSGVVLTRIEGVVEVRDPAVRQAAFWLHVITPLVAAWLFVLHRLAGKRIRWEIGRRWALVALVLGVVMLVLQAQDPRNWNVEGPEEGLAYFFPSLARTATGDFIPARVLQNDAYCQECHEDVHAAWAGSAHKLSSFNNPVYLFSVRETRRDSLARDGDVKASRFCAGCHDPVVFFSGRFDDPEFDDESDPTAHAGITCTVCHSISHINSPRGNSDYTIEEPEHYPFAFSDNPALAYINRQLVKAKPELHRRTFLKPFHKEAEFCGTCHKVHLPKELNDYKFLRGQNHYDSWLLSGVSGHGVASFYYPERAETNCNGCHMELLPSDDFGARRYEEGEGRTKPGVSRDGLMVHDHLFPSANTAVPYLLGLDPGITLQHRQFSGGREVLPTRMPAQAEVREGIREGVVRLDLFGLRKGGAVDGELVAPLRPEIPELVPGESYLFEVVVRTLDLGHDLTQGTSDSNQLWLDIEARTGDRLVGRSGARDETGRVDAWSHFVNTYMLERSGRRLERRNAEDIFVPLYNHQIPPGAGDVVHYRLDVPADATEPIALAVALRYRKFDTTLMQHIYGPEHRNDLPIMTLASDELLLPVRGGAPLSQPNPPRDILTWQRWNDYGIGLLRKGRSKGQLRQAEEAFARVEEAGRPEGPLNLARVYLEQGAVQERAVAALERAASFDPPAPEWSIAWFSAQVDKQNGFLDEAIERLEGIVELSTEETRRRAFDFSRDYRLTNELGLVLFERAKQERGESRAAARREMLERAAGWFEKSLALDPENVTAHYNSNLLYRQLGDDEKARHHLERYLAYKPDDNARDKAIAIARAADPAANHAAEAVVIYDLGRTLED